MFETLSSFATVLVDTCGYIGGNTYIYDVCSVRTSDL